MTNNAIKVITEQRDKMFSESMIFELSKREISDFDRGVIKGKIDMVNAILKELTEGSKYENHTVRTKIS